MDINLYNTLARKKERFAPRVPGEVTMYVCGPTVYNLAHIGNARPVVVFDVLFRLLQTQYQTVRYARNITDIDDKIITAARERGEPIDAVTSEFTQKFREDVAALGTLPPTLEPHATHNLGPMIAMVEALLDKGHAYEADGHVLFSVTSMPNYGELSGRNLDDMLAGARVEVADYKKHPGDFVLWKPAADDEPGWDSPWGRGRPGWHLECSAMIHEHLGLEIDIHGGGRDLIFPHHENEIAQSCCAYGGSYVRYWMHNAYIDIDGEKMSKSLGNFKTIRELLSLYRGEVLRFALLSAHYRSSLNFSKELLDQSENALNGLYNALRKVEGVESVAPESVEQESWYSALCDDLNTPLAISELHQLISELNKAGDSDKASLKGRILACAGLLGILQSSPSDWLRGDDSEGLSAEVIDALVAERVEAKAAKNYARADEIRAELTDAGVVLEDSPTGTTWRRA